MIDIIDIVDAGNIDQQLLVKPSAIERILLIRAEDYHGGIYALGLLRDKKKHAEQRSPKAVLFELGRLNFNGGRGGQMGLDAFRQWLEAEGLLAKVDRRLCHVGEGIYNHTFDAEQFDPDLCQGPANADAEEAERRFAGWLRGDPDWYRL
jgi:hypothetical protein